MPGCFKAAIFLLLQKGDVGYTEAVRNVTTSGGCTCSRANLIGACAAAKHGLSSIPTEWILKTKSINRVIGSVEKLYFQE